MAAGWRFPRATWPSGLTARRLGGGVAGSLAGGPALTTRYWPVGGRGGWIFLRDQPLLARCRATYFLKDQGADFSKGPAAVNAGQVPGPIFFFRTKGCHFM